MPWKTLRSSRIGFVEDFETGMWSKVELCTMYGVSRPTGDKWLRRYAEEGWEGLEERSRVPRRCPHRMEGVVRNALLAARIQYGWGARKVKAYLEEKHPRQRWPAESTINELFRKEGLVRRGRPRKIHSHPGRPRVKSLRANHVHTVDFKGHFRTRDHAYVYPLTVQDRFSRFLLGVTALPSTKGGPVKRAMTRMFRESGLPDIILTDNGTPFTSMGALHGLSKLNVWWMSLGIQHVRIEPGKPQQNGAHERMHRDLKAATAKKPATNLRGQQRKFDVFRDVYNHDRPHEALGNKTPASNWEPSARSFPEKIAGPDYPDHYVVRRVSDNATFRLSSTQVFLSSALNGNYVGLEEVDEGIWNIYFYDTLLARYDQRAHAVFPQ